MDWIKLLCSKKIYCFLWKYPFFKMSNKLFICGLIYVGNLRTLCALNRNYPTLKMSNNIFFLVLNIFSSCTQNDVVSFHQLTVYLNVKPVKNIWHVQFLYSVKIFSWKFQKSSRLTLALITEGSISDTSLPIRYCLDGKQICDILVVLGFLVQAMGFPMTLI